MRKRSLFPDQQQFTRRLLKKYSRETIGQVLAACDIVDVIGGYIDLKPAGGNRFKALSPFTNEKTPSFMVSRDRQLYYCFSSGRGGDVLRFIMEYEGLSFNEALQKLADQVGITLESAGHEDNREEYLRRRLLELNTFAARFYRRQLLNPVVGTTGREYLKRRGLQESTEARFGLGLAVDAYDQFRDAAFKEGFRESELSASGLVRRGDRALYDFFRNRVIIPIKDVSGNVAAFGGRDLGDSPAKYINSQESAVYKKGRVLYGLYEARDALRKEGRAILVEGYFDLMRCFDAGIENVVATCGTALTEQQAMLIKRYAPEVVVVYDADAAGIRAALRGIGLLVAAGLTVRAMTPPQGKDPDDFIREAGGQAFRDEIVRAKDFITYYIDMNADQLQTIEGRTEIAHSLFALLRSMDTSLRMDQYLRSIAAGLGIHVWECKREFERYCRNQRYPVRVESVAPGGGPDQPRSKPVKDDVDFIAALISFPELRTIFPEAGDEIQSASPAFTLAGRLCGADAGTVSFTDLDSEAEEALLTAAANAEAIDPDKARQIVTERLARFKSDAWTEQMAALQRQVQEAQRDRDDARTAELFDRIMELKRQIESLNAV
ncbi:MAG: DNA primase [Candidatus Hydrogenedentes bacterium]|nr:DNA primase [Candidatus Hydrogenedentota bacterium]